jgi:putative ABC transport system permease protein
MGQLNTVYLVLFAGILLAVLVLALRGRVLFRMGARNFVRHRTHSALVVGGLLIGTAIISGAMVTGDCIDNFIVKSTYESLDLVDVEVTHNNSVFFNESIYSEIAGSADLKKYSDGIAPMITTTVSAENPAANKSEPSVTLMGFNSEPDKGFGSFTKTDGSKTYGAGLGLGDAILNENAAGKLGAKAGQSITVTYNYMGYIPTISSFNVSYIVKDEGKGRFNLEPAAFIRLDTAQKLLNEPGKINLIRISGTGDMKKGVEKSDGIVKTVNATLHASKDPDAKNLKVSPIKKDSLAQAKTMGEMITMFITIFGSFSIIAGVILIINIFTMLAEERKSELGMARAVGMTRRDLMQMFMFEGSTYTVAAAAIGTFAGVLIAYGLMWGVNNVFSTFMSGGIPFSFEWTSLVNAFCLGGIITFLTIIVASWRVTNINIVRAIRDIEEPPQLRGSRASVAFGIILTALMALAFVSGYGNTVVRYTTPCIALMGIALIVRRFASSRLAFSACGFGIIAYTLYSIATFFNNNKNDTDIQYLFIVAGIFIVLAAVIIVMFNSNLVVGVVSGTIGRTRSMRPIVKTAVAHPLNKRFRTGMTIAMFSLVIFTIVMVSVFTGIFSINIDDIIKKQGGGYQIMGNSQMPVQGDLRNASVFDPLHNQYIPIKSPTLERDIQAYEQVRLVLPTPEMKIDNKTSTGSGMDGGMGGGMGFGQITLNAVDDHFITYSGMGFSNMSVNYSTPNGVWDAVKKTNSTVVVYAGSGMGGSTQVKVGTVIAMRTAAGEKNFTVVATLDTLLSGIFMTKNNSYAYFPPAIAPYSGDYIFLFKVKPGRDIGKVADGLKWDFRKLGMDAFDLKALIQTIFDMINSIFLLFEVFLGLGLVVGIAGLGIITIRSVVERKREIGIMRAIGFERRKILASQITEIVFIATLAVIIGIAVGLVVSYEIFTVMVEGVDVSFNIPWMHIGWVVLITYVAALACTIAPAYRASRIPPADALRINE